MHYKTITTVSLIVGIFFVSGCMSPFHKEVIVPTSGDGVAQEKVVVDESIIKDDTVVPVVDTYNEVVTEPIMNGQDSAGGRSDAIACVAAGGVYNAILAQCFMEGEHVDAETAQKAEDMMEITATDSDTQRARKECIADGGVYNTALGKCFME